MLEALTFIEHYSEFLHGKKFLIRCDQMRLNISPIPIGEISGSLSNAINRHTRIGASASGSVWVDDIFIANSDNVVANYSLWELKFLKQSIRLAFSESTPEVPDPPLFLIADFWIFFAFIAQ